MSPRAPIVPLEHHHLGQVQRVQINPGKETVTGSDPEGVVQDPAGTLLLVEQPEGGNIAGNDWLSFSMGPVGSASSVDQSPYQIVPGGRQKWGETAYGLHARRFNYLFHDSHVAIPRITDTVGTDTTNAPRGMWTMKVGD